MKKEELVVRPMRKWVKNTLIGICVALGAVILACAIWALVYFLQPLDLRRTGRLPQSSDYLVYYSEPYIQTNGQGFAETGFYTDVAEIGRQDPALEQVFAALDRYSCHRCWDTLAGQGTHTVENFQCVFRLSYVTEDGPANYAPGSMSLYGNGTAILDGVVYAMNENDIDALIAELMAVCSIEPEDGAALSD